MASAIDDVNDRITEIFKRKTILVTGGTGFMGKVFVEKMLRTCPDIAMFYLIVRHKKGKEPQERIKEAFENPVS